MAQTTIEVSDEFAQRLVPFQGQLSELFTRFVASTLPDDFLESVPPAAGSALPPATYQEVLDFLISCPTSQEIIDFKVSKRAQLRLEGGYILGLTPAGRTTDFLLKLNEPNRLQLRQSLVTSDLSPDS